MGYRNETFALERRKASTGKAPTLFTYNDLLTGALPMWVH